MASQSAYMMTAHDLLHKFLELREMTPDLKNWSEEQLGDNPPRLHRLQQLIALFAAFEIDWDPPSFVEGRFIQPANPRYSTAMELLISGAPEGRPDALVASKHPLPACFGILLRYRERVQDVLSFSSGFLEAGGLYGSALQKPDELNRIIRDNVAIIDDILVAFIDPEARAFPVSQLVRDYGYPDVDQIDINIDWL